MIKYSHPRKTSRSVQSSFTLSASSSKSATSNYVLKEKSIVGREQRGVAKSGVGSYWCCVGGHVGLESSLFFFHPSVEKNKQVINC